MSFFVVAKFLASLTNEESLAYNSSRLYKDVVLSTFHYQPLSLAYFKEYFGIEYIDHTIVVFNVNEPVLVLYSFSKNGVFTYFDNPVEINALPFDDMAVQNAAYKALLSKLNELLKEKVFRIISFFYNEFLLSEYNSKISHVGYRRHAAINLKQSKEQIKSNIRKSYKSLVNWGEKHLVIKEVNAETPDCALFDLFRNFHVEVAGRETRSKRSWEIQFEAIKANLGFICLGFLEEKLVAGTYITHGRRTAYYGVGVYDRKLMDQNIAVAHYTIIHSAYTCQKLGLEVLDVGYIDSSVSVEKELNIYKFKSGFTNTISMKNIITVQLC